MTRLISPLLIGIVFGLGIALSGMANPAKVLNFFDIAGTWDPSLVFVMFSAMFTAMIGYFFVLKRPKPVLADEFVVPKSKVIDRNLVLGSATFGVGWGISGFCPGGAIPALGIGRVEPFIFIAAMLAGIVVARAMRDRQAKAAAAA